MSDIQTITEQAARDARDVFESYGGKAREAIDYMEQLIYAAMRKTEPATDAAQSRAPFFFDRYINGVRMAEDVCIERETTLEGAMQAATRIAAKGPNGEAPVLVYRAPAADARAERDALRAKVARLEGDKQGLCDQIGKLLNMADEADKEMNGEDGLSMHSYGMTPDWFVEAAFWSCYGYGPSDPRAALTDGGKDG